MAHYWLYFLLGAWCFPALSCDPAKDASRIAVAGGSITEILYFLGEESKIIATDSTSTYPAGARLFPSIGYVRGLSAEGILSLKPSLILGEHDMGPEIVINQIENVSVDIRRIPEAHTTKGITDKIFCVAAVLGKSEEARTLVSESLGQKLELLKNAVDRGSTNGKFVIILSIRDGSPIVAGRRTSGDGLLRMVGAANIFSDIDGWKPVSLESIAASNPDFIVVAGRSNDPGRTIEIVKQNAAIKITEAAKRNQILVIDGMALLGFGPRTLDIGLELISLASD